MHPTAPSPRPPLLRRAAVPAVIAALCCALPVTASSAADVSDVMKVKRPHGGEYMGLYLLDKKVGYIFSDLDFLPQDHGKVRSVQEMFIQVNVGGKVAQRTHKETRIYEAKPNGRLLSFTVEQRGDGGEQTLEATSTAAGLTVIARRPGMANQIHNLPAPKERVEDADQVRVALLRNAEVAGTVVDGDDLLNYRVTTAVGKREDRILNGVKVHLRSAVTMSEKEKIPVTAWVTDDGAMVEVELGGNMKGRAEPPEVAKRMDKAEVFGLTRVVLPKVLPSSAREQLVMTLAGLPPAFSKSNYRQKFKKLADGKTEVTLLAVPPKVVKTLPVHDPSGGAYLKSTLAIESDSPEIQAQARRIVGEEKNAYAAAKKIVDWVGRHMVKDYGASSDRATDVLRTMRGDCTEHSLLSEALLRAAGIPARRVDGVVYVVQEDGVPALYWHEWVEAYVGEWTQLDPTFGEEVADATHFAVGEEGNAEILSLIGQMKVVEVR